MRKSKPEYFLGIAKVVAEQSTCTRANVGAVLVNADNNRIVSTGYSGAAPGSPHCLDVGCMLESGRCRRTVHAEMNALLYMNGVYSSLDLYTTHKPCFNCLKALISLNVKRIYYLTDYKDDIADSILSEMPLHRRPEFYHIV